MANENSEKNTTYNKRGNPFLRGKTWTILYYIENPKTGKKTQKWRGGFKTKKEAETALKEIEAAIVTGSFVEDKKMIVKQYLNQWFLESHKRKIEPNTINGYNVNINNHIIPSIGDIQLSKLDKNDINKMFDELIQKGLSSTTVKYVRNVLSKALNDAVGEELIKKNPCKYAALPKQKKYHAEVLDTEQIKQLLKASIGSSVELEVLLSVTLGLRRGEVLGLKFSDFDFKNKTVHIQRQVTTVKDNAKTSATNTNTNANNDNDSPAWGIKDLKTEGSNRIIAVPQAVINAVTIRKDKAVFQKAKMGKDYVNLDLVCCKDNGEFLSPQTVYHRFKALLEEAGLPDIRFHDLRHSCATLLLDYDIPLKVISQMLGHSTINITADIYCDVLAKKQQPADTVESILFSKENERA